MQSRTQLLASCLMLVSATAPPVAANLITNGDLEVINPTPTTPRFAPNGIFHYILSPGTSSVLPGFTVNYGTIDVNIPRVGEPTGFGGRGNTIDLFGATNQPGSLTTTFATVPGRRYLLDFDYAAVPAIVSNAWVSLTSDGTVQTDLLTGLSVNGSGGGAVPGRPNYLQANGNVNSLTSNNWIEHAIEFVATGSSTSLRIDHRDSLSGGNGIFLDDFFATALGPSVDAGGDYVFDANNGAITLNGTVNDFNGAGDIVAAQTGFYQLATPNALFPGGARPQLTLAQAGITHSGAADVTLGFRAQDVAGETASDTATVRYDNAAPDILGAEIAMIETGARGLDYSFNLIDADFAHNDLFDDFELLEWELFIKGELLTEGSWDGSGALAGTLDWDEIAEFFPEAGTYALSLFIEDNGGLTDSLTGLSVEFSGIVSVPPLGALAALGAIAVAQRRPRR